MNPRLIYPYPPMGNGITCTERLINPNLSRYRDSELRICIALRPSSVQIGISQYGNRIPLGVVNYEFDCAERSFLENIQEISRQEALLDPDFHYGRQTFTVMDFKSTLVPEKLYESRHARLYMEALFHLKGKECITEESDPHSKSHILTAFNNNYFEAAKRLLPPSRNLGFLSVYASLVRELFRVSRSCKRFKTQAVLHCREKVFDLCVKTDEGLVFINSFPFHDRNGILYYSLYALNKLKVDLGSTVLFLCGSASENRLIEIFENQLDTATYLPKAKPSRFGELAYDKYFICL